MNSQDLGTTSTGIKPNVAALIVYVLGWITGLIFFLIEKENKFVRFHALQSILVFGGLTALLFILAFLPVIGWVMIPVIYIAELVLWIVLMIKAYQGVKFKLPIAGDFAEKNT